MTFNRKLLWFVPIILGLAGLFLAPRLLGLSRTLWGLTCTWKNIGKPSDKVVKIIGVSIIDMIGGRGSDLIVLTDKGEYYTRAFYGDSSWEKKVSQDWTLEPHETIDVHSWPPPFHIQQLVETSYVAGAECVPYLRLGLSEAGEVWVWEYAVGCGLVPIELYTAYFLMPIAGFLLGGVLVGAGLGVSRIIALWKQRTVT